MGKHVRVIGSRFDGLDFNAGGFLLKPVWLPASNPADKPGEQVPSVPLSGPK